MQTAAGVAAGALAFEGVEAVLHGMGGFGHPGFGYGMPGMGMGAFGMGGGMMGGGFERPVEETVVNNYYDQPGGGEHHIEQGAQGFQGQEEHHFHESADQGGAQLSDAGYDAGTSDDQSSYDISQDDNVAQDDGGSGFDDGGGDSGGGFDGGGGDFS